MTSLENGDVRLSLGAEGNLDEEDAKMAISATLRTNSEGVCQMVDYSCEGNEEVCSAIVVEPARS